MSSYHKKRGEDKACSNCGKVTYKPPSLLLDNKSGKFFCSTKCQNDYLWNIKKTKVLKYGIEILGLKTSLSKERILKQIIVEEFGRGKSGRACWSCGWEEKNLFTGKGKSSWRARFVTNIPTQLSHIDGDPTNNDISNLEILCPNCHSLSEFHGSRGKGGRKTSYAKLKYHYVNNLTHG